MAEEEVVRLRRALHELEARHAATLRALCVELADVEDGCSSHFLLSVPPQAGGEGGGGAPVVEEAGVVAAAGQDNDDGEDEIPTQRSQNRHLLTAALGSKRKERRCDDDYKCSGEDGDEEEAGDGDDDGDSPACTQQGVGAAPNGVADGEQRPRKREFDCDDNHSDDGMEDECMPTQKGCAAAPNRTAAAAGGLAAPPSPLVTHREHGEGDDDGGADTASAAAPDGIGAALPVGGASVTSAQRRRQRPRLAAAAAAGAGAAPVVRRVRVAFTGFTSTAEDAAALRRCREIVLRCGGELEVANSLSTAATHLVCAPSVGAKASAKSIYAALSRKLLVGPEWLHAAEAAGDTLVEPIDIRSARGGTGASSSSVGGGVAAVVGIANPLHGAAVCLSDGFRRQHRADRIVTALLTGPAASLLHDRRGGSIVATCADARAAVSRGGVAFVSDAEEEAAAAKGERLCGGLVRGGEHDGMLEAGLMSWRRFLACVVPGHGGAGPTAAAAPAAGAASRSC